MTLPTSPHRRSRSSSARPLSSSPWQLLAPLFVVMLLPATALADKKDDAKAHVAKATKAHQNGHFEEARVELEAAYALDPNPDLLYAIGQVYAKLGKCGEATNYYKRFVSTQKDPQVAKVVDQAIAACKPATEPAANPPPPPATSPPPPAATTTDKPPVTENKPPVAENKPPSTKPAAATDKPAPAAPPPQPFASTPPAASPGATPSPWYKDKIGDGLVIGGAVATIVGLVVYSSARSDLDKAEDYTSTSNLADYQDLVDSAHGKRTASVLLIGGGGALITAGIVHYVRHGRTMETRGVAVAPAHGGGMVTYAGSF